MESPVHARIDTAAALHNCGVLRKAAGTRRLFAVVKADGYGHGMVPIVKAIAKEGVNGLCVYQLGDGEILRDAYIRLPILVMGGFRDPDELSRIAVRELWCVVHRPEQVEMLEGAPLLPPRVFLKVQTGMNRLGVAVEDVEQLVARLMRLRCDLALMHHFADADIPGGAERQILEMNELAYGYGLPFTASNSASTLLGKDGGEEFVRCGISVYGCTPAVDRTAASFGLRPVMTLASEVIGLQRLRKGDTVGYGSRWRAGEETTVAVIACGYADGYPRLAADGTPVAFGDRLLPIAGRVSMEMLTVEDAEGILRLGDEAQLWGDRVSADEVAASAGTISYELLAGMPAKTERRTV